MVDRAEAEYRVLRWLQSAYPLDPRDEGFLSREDEAKYIVKLVLGNT